jgi:hypothetical protein
VALARVADIIEVAEALHALELGAHHGVHLREAEQAAEDGPRQGEPEAAPPGDGERRVPRREGRAGQGLSMARDVEVIHPPNMGIR